MHPMHPFPLPHRMRKMNVQTPMEVTISVCQGHRTEDFGDEVLLASVLVERWYMAPGVRRIPVSEDGLTATLFLPPGTAMRRVWSKASLLFLVSAETLQATMTKCCSYLSEGPGPFPAVLDLWGGGGKLVEYRASLLASHGFASLALDYLTPKITIETGEMVGDDYFEVNPMNADMKKKFNLKKNNNNKLRNINSDAKCQ